MATTELINVLFVDDEKNNLTSFIGAFRRYFNVFTAISADEAETILIEQYIHVLITDQRMPDKTGTELLEETVKKYPQQIRILLTAYTDIESLERAVNFGHIFKYLKKPWNETELKEVIEEGYELFRFQIERGKLLKELQQKNEELNKILKQKDKPE